MASKEDLLLELGLRIPDLIAGFAGGVVNAVVFKRSNPWAIIGSILVGMFTANYLGETFAGYLRVNVGTASFLVGIGGMAIVQSAMDVIQKWRPFNLPPNSGGGGIPP